MLEFLGAYARITKDSVAGRTGEALVLRSWQEELVRRVFARTIDGRRKHRVALVGMARKNGKTSLAAGLALYGLLAEGHGAEVYSCAADRQQAHLVFGAAKRMVELDPELSHTVRVFRDALEVPTTGSIYRALSSEAFTKEGLSPTMVIYDELHAAPNRELFDVMQLAMGARVDPILLAATTAGVKVDQTGSDSIAHQLYTYGTRVASGEVEDPTFFLGWWEPDALEAPHDDAQVWAQANPGLGDILDAADIAAAAKPGRTPEAEFRTKRLNQWVNSSQAALPTGAFEACGSDRRVEKGETGVLFLDGSYSGDSTGLVFCTNDFHLKVVGLWERDMADPDWRVDIGAVEAAVMQACSDYNVVEVDCDPFRWQRSMQALEAAGLPVVEYNTSVPSRMVPAWATFYDAVIDGKVTHERDPRLIRHMGNVVLKVDGLGPRPVKEHRNSQRKIDLAVCAIGAFDRVSRLAGQPEETSVYDRRGFLVLG